MVTKFWNSPVESTTLTEAIECLKEIGSIEASSSNPKFIKALELLKASQSDEYFIHKETGNVLLTPKVGMGCTKLYPSDRYPFEVIKIVSDKCIEIRAMSTRMPGAGFTLDINQDWELISNPNGEVIRIRLNSKGRWMNDGIPFAVGQAKMYRDPHL